MIYKFNNKDLGRCNKFADEQLESSAKLYIYRGEANIAKIHQDIVIGKLGELIVARHLRKSGKGCSRVDFSIYERKKKSFDPDLIFDGNNIHVKSQGLQSIKRYGKSWLLQKNDKITRNPEENDYICFTSVDLESSTVEILGIVKVQELVNNNCLGEPRVPRYRHSKVALYFDQVQETCRVYREL